MTEPLSPELRDMLRDKGWIAVPLDAAKPCPWCGHPPMCHKGPEGECPADNREADRG